MVLEGILAFKDRAAVALEEMTEGFGVCVQGLDGREHRSAEAVCRHFCVDGMCESRKIR